MFTLEMVKSIILVLIGLFFVLIFLARRFERNQNLESAKLSLFFAGIISMGIAMTFSFLAGMERDYLNILAAIVWSTNALVAFYQDLTKNN